jgi:hypothetical protein
VELVVVAMVQQQLVELQQLELSILVEVVAVVLATLVVQQQELLVDLAL